jgi:hypothetical protein
MFLGRLAEVQARSFEGGHVDGGFPASHITVVVVRTNGHGIDDLKQALNTAWWPSRTGSSAALALNRLL